MGAALIHFPGPAVAMPLSPAVPEPGGAVTASVVPPVSEAPAKARHVEALCRRSCAHITWTHQRWQPPWTQGSLEATHLLMCTPPGKPQKRTPEPSETCGC